MDLVLHTQWTRDGAVIVCRGRLVHGASLTRLKRSVREVLYARRGVVVIDLSEVSDIDAAGVGALALIVVEGRVANGRIRMTRPSRRVLTLIRMTRLDSQITWMSPSAAHAINVA